jgi:hypothetical protein
MQYKKKLITLVSLAAFLALTYITSIIFDPETAGNRSALYTWLDSKASGEAVKIVISAAKESAEIDESIEIIKEHGQWLVLHNERKYPARQFRVEDFTGIFTKTSAWPVRSSSADSHARLGLTEASAVRTVISGEKSVLLDILLGGEDITGREIYIRRYGQTEVRSGENKISQYINGSVNSWYNLRLIPESEDNKIDVGSVQRLSVYEKTTQVFSRRNRDWVISGISVEKPDKNNIEAYIKTVLNTEGDDFIDTIADNDPLFTSSIVIELGSGNVRTIRLTEPDESGRRYANVTGTSYIYSLAPWAAQRLFKNASDFEMQ